MITAMAFLTHYRPSLRMKKILAIALLLCSHLIIAQPETTMLTMTGVSQHSNYNPAFVPNYKFVFSIGMVSAHTHYSNSSFKYNDLVVKRGDSLVADLPHFEDQLNDKNYVTVATDVEVFRLGIKAGKRLYFNWYVTNKAYGRQMIPKELVSLISNGNAGFVNQTASFAPQFEGLAYLESAWGASYMVNDKLTVGGRIKLLRGVLNVTTENTDITMALDENYATTVSAQVNVKTSGIQSMDNEIDFKNYLKNKGLALDVGATLKVTKELTVGASLLDIGGINWNHDTYAYTLNKSEATYTFEGIDLQKVLDGDDDYMDALKDSIEEKFDLQEGAIGSYRTPLPGKMYLTASYAWKRNTTFGALLFFEKFRGRFYPGFSASAHKEFGRIMGASLSYTAVNRTYGNFGLGLNLNLTPFQFYVVGDNLLRMPTSYLVNKGFNRYISETQYFNLRVGLNFVFGRVLPEDRKTYNSRKK